MLALLRCYFHPRDSAVSRKRHRSLPLTHRNRRGLTMLSRHRMVTYQESDLTRNSSENARPRSAQLAELPWTASVPKEWNCIARVDLHFKKKTVSGSRGLFGRTFPKNSRVQGKSHHYYNYRQHYLYNVEGLNFKYALLNYTRDTKDRYDRST